MSESKFQVGDTVTWTSQAGGNAKMKTGKVVYVIPARYSMHAFSRQFLDCKSYTTNHLNGTGRDYESYLIQVGKSKRLYWPLVKYLKPIAETITLSSEDPEEGGTLTISKVTEKGYEMKWRESQEP